MENTSKALLIAGSILLSILIIMLGIYISNRMKNIDIESEMSKIEVQIFNQEYLLYEGVQPGQKVKYILEKAAAFNAELSSENGYTNFSILSEHGMGVRGTAIDIIEPASKLTQDWILQLKNQGNYKVGVAMPANIRRISSWIKPNKKYRISLGNKKTKINKYVRDCH